MSVSFLQGAGTTGHPNYSRVRLPYVVEVSVDFADVLVAKGSALAANDVYEVLAVPAGTMLIGAGVEIVTAVDATAATLDIGWGSNADVIADGVDAKTTGYGAAGTNGSIVRSNVFSAADTLDITLKTLTGTLATGVARVYAILVDVA